MTKNKFAIYAYFLRQFKGKLALFLFCSLGLSLSQVVLIAVLYPFVSFSINQGDAGNSGGFILEHIRMLVSRIPVGDPLIAASILLIVMGILQGLFRYLSVWSSMNLSYGIISSLQKRMYEKVVNADLTDLINKKQGDFTFQVKDPPLKVGYIVRGTSIVLRETLVLLFIIAMMLSVNVKLTFFTFLVGGVFSLVIKYVTKKSIYKTGKASIKALGEEDVILSESLNGIYTIKAFWAEQFWIRRFVHKVQEYVAAAKKTQLMKELPLATLEAIVIVLIAVAAVVFRALYADSFVKFMPVFSVFAVSILKIIPSFRNLSNAGMDIVALFPNMEICYDLLHRPDPAIKNGDKQFREFKESIDFKNVRFSYPGHEIPIFEDLSTRLKKNEITAIVGKSGSGKTTLINLLLRFYDPTRGHIEVDGVDLRNLERASWLEKIGYVSQEPFIFHATIEENIRFWGDYDEADIIEAAKQAGAHDFIMSGRDGYRTIVGEKGMKLSGGQKQRIAIARALLRRPQILIFDEATSALDTETEKHVQETIRDIASSYTVIIIAHRLSTVKIANNILVFEGGRLLEEGSHDALLKADSYYSRLYALSLV